MLSGTRFGNAIDPVKSAVMHKVASVAVSDATLEPVFQVIDFKVNYLLESCRTCQLLDLT